MARTLGRDETALTSSALGFGCMGITAFYGEPLPDEDAVKLLLHAYEHGVTHFDTAEAYRATAADGSTIFNETVVGKALQSMDRGNVLIATKYAPGLHGNQATSDLVLEACRASCERLQVSHVDLYYAHRFAADTTVEEQARAFKAVMDAGLAKRIGVSEFSPKNLRAFHAICPVSCVQQEWSLFNRDLEEELLPTCRELGVGVVAYSPLSRSLLSCELQSAENLKQGDLRTSRYPRLSVDNIPKNAALAENLKPLAEKHGVSPAQLALAWVMGQGVDVVPIPGTTQIGHLSDNMAARALTLSREDLEEIASAVPTEHVSGERYHKPTDWFVGQMEKRRKTEEEPEPEQQVPGT